MVRLKNTLISFYRNVTGSIAFYPTVISLCMTLMAVIVLVAERNGITDWLQKYLAVLVTYSVDTARTILSVLIGSILSLTVFSFSMVMILLNQAASYFSPRVVPGLISSKSHQYVLGTYLGTVMYCLLILINIYKPDNQTDLPGFAILLAIIFGVVCMGLFVYFIHNISIAIQASNILYKIFLDTRHDLRILQEEERRHLSVNEHYKTPETPYPVFSEKTGYLQAISEESLLGIAEEKDMQVKMDVTRGMFVLKNIPIARTSKQLEKEATDQILSCFQFSNRELVRENYILGFKQITEVAVKAMSPGINDPGTALTAIDFLTELLAIRMTISDFEFFEDKEGNRRVFFNTVSFHDLIYNTLASLRQYVKHDIILVQKLLMMLQYLLSQRDAPEKYLKVVKAETETLLEDALSQVKNSTDRKTVEKLAKSIGVEDFKS